MTKKLLTVDQLLAMKKEHAVLKRQNAELRGAIKRILPYAEQLLRDKDGFDSIARTDIQYAYDVIANKD